MASHQSPPLGERDQDVKCGGGHGGRLKFKWPDAAGPLVHLSIKVACLRSIFRTVVKDTVVAPCSDVGT